MISKFYALKKSISIISLILILSFKLHAQKKTVGLIKHLAGAAENGYILFNPIGSDTTFLMNKCGKVAHTWYSKYWPGLTAKLLPNGNLLRAGVLQDTVFGAAGGKGGVMEILDWNSNVVWSYKLFNDSTFQHHEVYAMPNGNVMVVNWFLKNRIKAEEEGRNPLYFQSGKNEIWGEKLIELKPIGADSADIVWEWNVWDHLVQDYDSVRKNYGSISQHPELVNINYATNLQTADWLHFNGIDYNPDFNQILISVHNLSEIWIIDHSTTKAEAASHTGGNSGKGGDILYRWGNPEAYAMGTSTDRKLFKQHNANWIPDGYRFEGRITIFNNGWGRDTNYSTVDVIKPPVSDLGLYSFAAPFGPAKPVWQYKDSIPTNFYSQIISGAHRMPNGNTMVCSGVQGLFFELTLNKKIVWEYRNPIGSNNIIQKDGETPKNNSVFRCTFIPDTFSGLKNKNLAAFRTIEKKSRIYTCNIDNDKPSLTALSPSPNTTNVKLAEKLKITFSETVIPIVGGFANIYQNNILKEKIIITSSSVNTNLNEVTITTSTPFSINSRIKVSLSTGSLRDSAYNLINSIDTTTWYFYTVKSAPNIVEVKPNNLNNVAINTNLQIKFNQKIFKNTVGNIRIYEGLNLKENIAVTSGNITILDSIVYITPSSVLKDNSDIYVKIDDCFVDVFGTPNVPTDSSNWHFKTVLMPRITSYSPPKNSKNIAISTNLMITHNKVITKNNVGNYTIFSNGLLLEKLPILSTSISIWGGIVTLNPTNALPYAKRISVSSDANVLSDSLGNTVALLDSSNWSFNTVANTSIKKITSSSATIFPNPNNGHFNIQNNTKIESVKIYDALGKEVEFKINLQNDSALTIDILNLISGVYLVVINKNNFNTIIKY